MEKNSKNILKDLLTQFTNKSSIKKILIIDKNGNILTSSQKLTSEMETILNYLNESGIFKLKTNVGDNALEKLILEYEDFQIILFIPQNEHYILAINENKKNLNSILNELNPFIAEINNFFVQKEVLGNFQHINLDENIKKLEEYLKIMQPPKFKNIKKLIDYIS
ncbi:MAG: hypothetical protein ACFFCM_06400 [Promethearchaeota archaeon]